MTASLLAYDEVAEFISALNPQKIIGLKPSEKVQARVDYLIIQKKENTLNTTELHELERYLALEHLIALAKIRARKLIKA